MSKTWVSSSSTARPRPQRGRGIRAGSFSGPTEQQQRLGDGRFAQRSSLREDEEWGQQTQARSSVSGGGFEDPAPMSISQVSGGQEERQLQRYVDLSSWPLHVFARLGGHMQAGSVLRPTPKAFTSPEVEKW